MRRFCWVSTVMGNDEKCLLVRVENSQSAVRTVQVRIAALAKMKKRKRHYSRGSTQASNTCKG